MEQSPNQQQKMDKILIKNCSKRAKSEEHDKLQGPELVRRDKRSD